MTAPKPDDYLGAAAVNLGTPDLDFEEPRPPHYEAPWPRNALLGPLCVSVLRCPRCGATFAHWGEALLAGETRVCQRCQLVPLVVPPEIAAIMAHLRWKFDECHHAHLPGVGSTAAYRAAFLAVSHACWLHGETLLLELERIYGNQVLAQTQAIATGG